MKKIICIVMALMLTTTAYSAGIYGEWAKESIELANRAGLLSPDMYVGDFTKPITRGEISELVVKAYENTTGEKATFDAHLFSDSDNEYVSIVNKLGIMNGRGDGVFSPSDNTTRQEMAKIMLVFKAVAEGRDFKLPTVVKSDFTDFDSVSDWAKPYVSAASEQKIITGYEDGTFGAGGYVTWQEAITLVSRTVELNIGFQPQILSDIDTDVVSSDKDLTINVRAKGKYTVYAIEAVDGANAKAIIPSAEGENFTIPAGTFLTNAEYLVYVCRDGVYSEPVNIFTDRKTVVSELPSFEKITWNRDFGDAEVTIKVTEHRRSRIEGAIAPNETKQCIVQGKNYFNLEVNPNRKYVVEIICGDFYETKTIYTERGSNEGAAKIEASYPKSKDEALPLMTTVTVPVWRLSGEKKVSSTAEITVHRDIASKVELVFLEIYNGKEQFPIKDVGGFSWRGGSSEHNGGTAIDINYNENYCIYSSGRVVGDYWKPYEDPYSITPYGDVVNAFEKYGFTWGGDAWSSTKDYMHFSYLGG